MQFVTDGGPRLTDHVIANRRVRDAQRHSAAKFCIYDFTIFRDAALAKGFLVDDRCEGEKCTRRKKLAGA